jgi:stage IV sporulation protein B
MMLARIVKKLVLAGLVLLVPCVFLCIQVGRLPDSISMNENESKSINFNIPLRLDLETAGKTTKSVNFSEPVSFTANQAGEYRVSMKLFGVFGVKTMTVNVTNCQTIIPCGFPVGIYLRTSGVLVVDTTSFISEEQVQVNPCQDSIRPGDYITSVNGTAIQSKSEFMSMVEECDGKGLSITLTRDGTQHHTVVFPVKDVKGSYKTGLWIKDDAQGIGTLTYMTTDGQFAALGHGISDTDTGTMLDISSGTLYYAKILSIMKGAKGQPGELAGSINYGDGSRIGTISANLSKGIYGSVTDVSALCDEFGLCEMKTAFREDVKKGTAYIQSGVSGKLEQYEISIKEVLPDDRDNKNIVFTVTDKRLLDITNGIVQGMSGSPIIQNDCVIGAVTHVFVDDSTSGYGIFIESMLGSHAK